MHAELFSNRISELEDKAPSNPSEWEKMSNIGSLDPLKHLSLRTALERAFEFEGKAVQNYNRIAKGALEINDFVTYNLATIILADEVKDEQHTECAQRLGGEHKLRSIYPYASGISLSLLQRVS